MPSKNCDFSQNCKKLEKSQLLLKLIKSNVGGGRRVSSKHCDFSKNCEKFGEVAVFARRVSSKNCDSCNVSQNCEKLDKSQMQVLCMR